MRTQVKDILQVATKWERLAKSIRDNPEGICEAISALRGEEIESIDPVYLPPSERQAFISRVARKIGFSSQDLMDVYDAVSSGRRE